MNSKQKALLLIALSLFFLSTNTVTAEAAITDLNVNLSEAPNPDSLTISWTIPLEVFSGYDIRYATQVIRETGAVTGEENWEDAISVSNTLTQGTPGTTQSFQITGLDPRKLYYIAIKTINPDDTLSEISNKTVGFTNIYNNIISPLANGHPRIWIKPETLPILLEKVNTDYSEQYAQLKNWVDTTPLPRTGNPLGRDGAELEVAPIGLVALIEDHRGNTESQYKDRIIDLGNLAAKRELGTNNYLVDEVAVGNKIFILSICLDWGWSFISQEEKDLWANELLDAIDYLPNIIRREPYQGWALRIHSGSLYGAAVLDGEGYADSQTRGILNYSGVWKLKNGLLGAFNHIGTDGGFFPSGISYTKGFVWTLIKQAMAWQSATGEDLFAMSGGMRNFALCMAYHTLPISEGNSQPIGEILRIGEDSNPVDLSWYGHHAFTIGRPVFSVLGAYYDDGLAQYYKNLLPEMSSYLPSVTNKNDIWPDILWGSKNVVETLPEEILPVNMDVFTENAGVVIMRGQDELVSLKATDWYYGHQHGDAGSFQIYYKTPLAIRSGFYDWWGGTNAMHYFRNTYAYNAVTIDDPVRDRYLAYWNETEGQNTRAHDTPTIAVAPGSEQDLANMFFESEDNYSWAVADITNATKHTTGAYTGYNKVEKNIRQLVRLKGDTVNPVIIHDKISATEADFKKRWYLHSATEPVISGQTIMITNREGRLFSRTILPENADFVVVGGEGREFWVNNDGSGVGTNYPLSAQPSMDVDFGIVLEDILGAWRVEVNPDAAAKEDQFLHVLYPVDASVETMPETAHISYSDANAVVNGVHIKDINQNAIILFKEDVDSGLPVGEIRYSFTPTVEKVEHLLLGMAGNTRFDVNITYTGEGIYSAYITPGSTYLSSENGALNFEYIVDQGIVSYDVNEDGLINILDVIFCVNAIVNNEDADADNNGITDSSDLNGIVNSIIEK